MAAGSTCTFLDPGGGGFLMPGIMGEVQERKLGAARVPRPPTGGAAGTAFPAATHRSKSKVGLRCHFTIHSSYTTSECRCPDGGECAGARHRVDGET